MNKPPLLLLVHRLPYPPNKGDKIRSWHMLRFLVEHFEIHLATFVDDPADWTHAETLRSMLASYCIQPLHPLKQKILSLRGLFTGDPLTVTYYRNTKVQSWVDETILEYRVDTALVFCSSMASYVEGHPNLRRVIDFVDIDSDKWQQYVATARFPLRQIYAREAQTLLSYERKISRKFDASLFVSKQEANLFKTLSTESADKVYYFDNGVDLEYFNPDLDMDNPFGGPKNIVFTGAMDYWANADAVTWFADQVWPEVLSQQPEAKFYIVGSKPSDTVQALGRRAGIVVTGRVEDVRPWLRHASLCVAPMRIARGIQNKVLEAMAMAKPVLVSLSGMEGIPRRSQLSCVVTDDSEEWTRTTLQWLANPPDAADNREFTRQHYQWSNGLTKLYEVLVT